MNFYFYKNNIGITKDFSFPHEIFLSSECTVDQGKCAANGEFDASTCSCKCKTGFTGLNCDGEFLSFQRKFRRKFQIVFLEDVYLFEATKMTRYPKVIRCLIILFIYKLKNRFSQCFHAFYYY